MPTRIKIGAKLLLVAVALVAWSSPAASWVPSELEAKEVLLRYFDALSQGDTVTLQHLMAGNLLQRRELLLENPVWPAYLGATFGGAELSIQNIETLETGEVLIEAHVVHGMDDIVLRRFILEKSVSSLQSQPQFRVIEEMDAVLD